MLLRTDTIGALEIFSLLGFSSVARKKENLNIVDTEFGSLNFFEFHKRQSKEIFSIKAATKLEKFEPLASRLRRHASTAGWKWTGPTDDYRRCCCAVALDFDTNIQYGIFFGFWISEVFDANPLESRIIRPKHSRVCTNRATVPVTYR
jgi:hypothetical protein